MLITLDNGTVRGQPYGSESMSCKTKDMIISRMASQLLDEQNRQTNVPGSQYLPAWGGQLSCYRMP